MITEVELTVVVQSETGDPLSGLDVTATSGTEKDNDVTGPSGRAHLKISHDSSTQLNFDFKSDTVTWTDAIRLLPEGVEDVTVYFRVDRFGKVLFTRLEY